MDALLQFLIVSILATTAVAQIYSLEVGEYYPNSPETSASGPSYSTITRGSDRFYSELFLYDNQFIVFKDEEESGADHIMTQRCSEKLNFLADLVSNEWPGVYLRVTEAWDEDGEHSDNSLHYSGRAVDITTSDRDESKYGRLAGLAVQADFDWVLRERNHIHASVGCSNNQFRCDNGECIAQSLECNNIFDCFDESDEYPCGDPTEPPVRRGGGGCFPTDATVFSHTGPIKIQDLTPGTKILAMDDKGDLIYSPVITFMDSRPEIIADFINLKTEDGHSLTLTFGHLVYTVKQGNISKLPTSPKYASKLKEGEFIYTLSAENKLQLSKIQAITVTKRKGQYAPLTLEGTIIVDGVLASCYAVIDDHEFAHMTFAPLRRLYQTVPATLLEQTEGDLLAWYPKALEMLGRMILDEERFFPASINAVLGSN